LNTGMHVDRGSAESLRAKYLRRLCAAAEQLSSQLI
jgi:hypothetical protein